MFIFADAVIYEGREFQTLGPDNFSALQVILQYDTRYLVEMRVV